MAAQGRRSAVLMVMALLLASCAVAVEGVDHVVGGTVGWTKPDGSTVPTTYLSTWATGKTFNDGDNLIFNYNAVAHNVLQVSEKDYTDCITTAVLARHTTGKDTIKLVGGTTYYFICGTGTHCKEGQKLTITTSGTPGASKSPTSAAPVSSISTATLLHVITASALALLVITIAL